MATDYDAPRKNEDEVAEDSIEELKSRRNDAGSSEIEEDENEAAGHPLQLLTGHEVVVDGAYMSGADGSVPGLANVDPEGYVRQWQAYERRDWEAVRTEQDRLADLMRIVQVKGVQGFGAGVGAFKAALRLLGVFDSAEMPRPVAALEGDNVEHVASVLRTVGLLS